MNGLVDFSQKRSAGEPNTRHLSYPLGRRKVEKHAYVTSPQSSLGLKVRQRIRKLTMTNIIPPWY
jgi:hypothetical protein